MKANRQGAARGGKGRQGAHLVAQQVPAAGDGSHLGADPVGHDVRTLQLPASVLDARQPLLAVVLHVVLQVLKHHEAQKHPLTSPVATHSKEAARC